MFDRLTEENKPPAVLSQYRTESLDEPDGGSDKKDDDGNVKEEKSAILHILSPSSPSTVVLVWQSATSYVVHDGM
ncbi:hypothetical protein LTR95_005580 [Oleoguttula sp. CCFEE 5521]